MGRVSLFGGDEIPLKPEEFRLLRDLVGARTGINFAPDLRFSLERRLRERLAVLGLTSFAEYYQYLRFHPAANAEWEEVQDLLTTNETYLFREDYQLYAFRDEVAPMLAEQAKSRKRLSIWSAGCSTGEEVYSIAMVLADALPASQGWSVEVKATDISSRVLGVARDATWPIERASEIPRRLLERFMLEGIGPKHGWLRAAPELRDLVRVERFNLNDARYPLDEPFDVVFCRNVLIYFERGRKRHVVERLAEQLLPGGRLFLGHAETVHSTVPALRCVGQTVYAVAGDGDAADRTAGGRA